MAVDSSTSTSSNPHNPHICAIYLLYDEVCRRISRETTSMSSCGNLVSHSQSTLSTECYNVCKGARFSIISHYILCVYRVDAFLISNACDIVWRLSYRLANEAPTHYVITWIFYCHLTELRKHDEKRNIIIIIYASYCMSLLSIEGPHHLITYFMPCPVPKSNLSHPTMSRKSLNVFVIIMQIYLTQSKLYGDFMSTNEQVSFRATQTLNSLIIIFI